MHKPQKRNPQSPQKSVDWLEYINDCLAMVIPVGPRFQVDVPEWTGRSNEAYLKDEPDTSRWLGTRIWPLQDKDTETEGDECGKGRPDVCSCSSPGSARCVKYHVSAARTSLQSDLGPAFLSWKFNEMGEDVANSWSSRQRQKFGELVKTNPLSKGKNFLRPAESYYISKTRKDIVSYYLNVHVPKRINMITRSGCKVLDSDDDEVEEAPAAKNSLKRSRPSSADASNPAKSHYLIGRR